MGKYKYELLLNRFFVFSVAPCRETGGSAMAVISEWVRGRSLIKRLLHILNLRLRLESIRVELNKYFSQSYCLIDVYIDILMDPALLYDTEYI